MSPIQQNLSRKVAPIPKPTILLDDDLSLSCVCFDMTVAHAEPSIHGKIDDVGLEIDCRIGRDLITSLPFKSLVVEPVLFPLNAPTGIFEIPPLSKPSIWANLFHLLEAIRVFGMNYQHRIWREIRLIADEPVRPRRQKNKSFTKSYLEPERQTTLGPKPKPKAPSFWDLVYALLQPPLTIEKVENLYLPHDLYPFQKTGIQFLMDNESALLADEMGTGKTVQTAVAIRLLVQKARTHSALVVCPVAVLRQWDEHLRDWAPELLVTVVRGNQQTRILDWSMPAHVYITAYDTLRKDVDEGILPQNNLSKFDVVILDEAQYIKNAESGRAKAIRKLTARQRWALTGTPIENRIEDVASIFDFLRPGYLTPFDLYPARVREKISPHFLRRRKEDVLKDLPPKIRQEFWLELDANQRKAYNDVLKEGQTELRGLGEKVKRTDIFRILIRLKQICNFAPGQLNSPKLDLLLEQVETINESGQKVIVFSQYIGEGIEKIETALKGYGLSKIIGTQSDRDFQVKQFQESKSTPILIASVRAGGVGLNLQVASYVVHFDHWWNPAVMWQAEARAHRQGQKQTVNVYSYWVADTIEEKIYETLKAKGLLFADIVDGLSETELDNVISTEEWLDMLGVRHKPSTTPPKFAPLTLSLSEIQEKLQTMPPSDFERVAKDLLHCFGYPNTKITGRTGDGGIDVISTRNTADGIVRVVAQCKRYKGSVSVETARAFMGVIASDDSIEKGYLVTTGEFTRESLAFCEKSGVIVTLNGVQVANYVRQFGIQI
jgi:HJR/Mrr/RecB family endonuclease